MITILLTLLSVAGILVFLWLAMRIFGEGD